MWNALVDPEAIKKKMLGATVTTGWREGGPIYWKGEWNGKTYEDKGIVLHVHPTKALEYSHYSPAIGTAG